MKKNPVSVNKLIVKSHENSYDWFDNKLDKDDIFTKGSSHVLQKIGHSNNTFPSKGTSK
jgi:hypothetical protein